MFAKTEVTEKGLRVSILVLVLVLVLDDECSVVCSRYVISVVHHWTRSPCIEIHNFTLLTLLLPVFL